MECENCQTVVILKRLNERLKYEKGVLKSENKKLIRENDEPVKYGYTCSNERFFLREEINDLETKIRKLEAKNLKYKLALEDLQNYHLESDLKYIVEGALKEK